MRRYATPAALISAVCLLVSLAVHLPIYWSLGKLKEALFAEEANRPRGSAPSEVEFNVDDGLTEADLQEEAKRAESKLRDKPPDEQKRDVAKQNEEKKKEVAVAAAVPAEAKPPPPPKPKASQQAIQQKSEDPTVAPPPDAKYLAEENRRVEEETVARERSFTEDSPQPQSGATRNSAGEDPGNDKETEVADSRNREGDASRHATEAEARQERPDSSRTPPPPVAA
ncbi:MAG: hypothetical protein KC417_14640, partial [Myxococcales bacterium]|nr:hypothetical protein [Myxococcales bacterium]